MDLLFKYFDSSLIVLALVLFFATLVVIFFLLSRDSKQRRISFVDRRRNKQQLLFPFYDSQHELVSKERRVKDDRRKARAIHVGNVSF